MTESGVAETVVQLAWCSCSCSCSYSCSWLGCWSKTAAAVAAVGGGLMKKMSEENLKDSVLSILSDVGSPPSMHRSKLRAIPEF